MKSILLFICILLSISLSPSYANQAASLPANTGQEVQKLKQEAKPSKKINRLKQVRAMKKAMKKSSIFSYLSLAFSGMTLLALVLVPSTALTAYILIVGGFLLLAIIFMVIAVTVRLKEMRSE